jgi:hypothetical protein
MNHPFLPKCCIMALDFGDRSMNHDNQLDLLATNHNHDNHATAGEDKSWYHKMVP